MSESAAMIEVSNLSKHFGPIKAVDGVTFDVRKGEVLGFLGPNGAGKSTTMKMITGFVTPSGGTAKVCGHDVTEEPVAVKRKIGYLPEGAPAYPDMTPAAFLDFVAGIRALSGPKRRERLDYVIETVHLGDVMYQPIDTLSKGFKRRVGLAQALLHDPEVLILDEPTDGLDPNQKHEVRSLIGAIARDKAIVISTHILEEVTAICTRALIIARGKVLADGTPLALEMRSRWHNAVSVVVKQSALKTTRDTLAPLPGIAGFEEALGEGGLAQITAFARDGASIVEPIGAALRARGLSVEEIRVERGRLDEVFRTITTA